uniref:ATP synthase F0 subunit 6 n=1 Tax=Paramarcius puncticeps TaxID=2924071 RepID=UPI001FA6BC3F|nr:ATP synthase F0 subunit 6 [Paramarcius puncticeps]UMY75887.1 ATP synthase F0 subunit 6 [Paramarcius puncticeps]
MMTNLFSSFDPSTSIYLSFNWLSTITCFMLIPLTYWFLPNRMIMMKMLVMNVLNKEFKMIMNYKMKGSLLMMMSMFSFIMINNLMGLLPYIFTSSSHLTFSLSLALPLWLTLMIFGWLNNTNHMFAHLIPTGTPSLLMPFMVLIETISNIIRPGSLAVRLTANMIAGHLLMTLLGNSSLNCKSYMMMLITLIQILLMMFELAVSLIQAYVFSILSTLYSSEI